MPALMSARTAPTVTARWMPLTNAWSAAAVEHVRAGAGSVDATRSAPAIDVRAADLVGRAQTAEERARSCCA